MFSFGNLRMNGSGQMTCLYIAQHSSCIVLVVGSSFNNQLNTSQLRKAHIMFKRLLKHIMETECSSKNMQFISWQKSVIYLPCLHCPRYISLLFFGIGITHWNIFHFHFKIRMLYRKVIRSGTTTAVFFIHGQLSFIIYQCVSSSEAVQIYDGNHLPDVLLIFFSNLSIKCTVANS